jgi:TolB-like protein/Tfp pilus assembly protein PilF
MNRLKRLIAEIHRRSLWQVLGIYLVGAAVGYQLIQALTEGLSLPDWFPAFAIVLFIILLPVVLATAVVQEGVRGPRRPEAAEPAVREARGVHHRFFTWRNAGLSFLAALALWGVVATGWYLLADRTETEGVEAAAETRKSLAVLPFENLSLDPENEFFTDGMHDEIIAHLSRIADLKVISRTSVMEYKGRSENLRTIAEQLEVTNILEGTVRRANGRVRITTQLIDALADEHLWTEVYDRSLSDVFAVQSDVAQQVAAALRAELTAAERERIEEIPTDNLEAYEFYLRGMGYYRRPGWAAEKYRSAQRMWEQAVDLDPSFALAHVWLSIVHSLIYFFGHDHTEERLRLARAAADRALELDPDLPEGHLALGHYFYRGFRAYDQALEELAVAEQGLPGDAELLSARGYIYRRQGKWEEAIANLQRAAELDPRDASLFLELGWTHGFLRRYDEAERYYDKALAVEPEYELAVYARAQNRYWRDGDLEPLRAFVSAYPDAHSRRRWLEVLNRDYPAALDALSQVEDEIIVEYFDYGPKSLFSGLTHLYAGQAELARAAFDSARVLLEAAVSERPDDQWRHQSLGVAYAGLGMKEAAVREGQMAVDLMPVSRDAILAPIYLRGLANIYTMVGDYDAAIDLLDYLLSIPSWMSVPQLRLHPMWDPLRDHPRFQALLEKYE